MPIPVARPAPVDRVASPFLTAPEAAAYLRFPSVAAFYVARHKHRIRGIKRGRTLLFRIADLERFLVDEPLRLLRLRERA